MIEDEKTVEQRVFYEKCAELLSCAEHTFRKFPYRKRTRWNNREAGNGRYPGKGMIRMFSNKCIQVNLRVPRITGVYTSPEDVYTALDRAVKAEDFTASLLA